MRVLVVDDEACVRDAYRFAFAKSSQELSRANMRSLAGELFAEASEPQKTDKPPDLEELDVDYCAQGSEAVSKVEQALAEPTRYKVAFVDVRMPPGIDGKETARRIRELDPDIFIVIVTAYSDHAISDIAAVAGPADRLLYLKKPFVVDEIRQMATSLVARWDKEHGPQSDQSTLDRLTQELQTLEQDAAMRDFLTGAPNRFAFQRELDRKVACKSDKFSVAVVDLDGLEAVNEDFGTEVGDDLLRHVYAQLTNAFGDGSFVARMGEDDFALIIETGPARALTDMRQALTRFDVPIADGTRKVTMTASAGLVEADKAETAKQSSLLRFARIALATAKERTRGDICLFDAEMKSAAHFKETIRDELARALREDELELHYQPIVLRETEEVVGFEALVRWPHPVRGSISPGIFVPVAEEGPLIFELGEWILCRALADCCLWPGHYVSINVSPQQFRGMDIEAMLLRKCAAAGLAHERVQIEVTETALFHDPAHSFDVLNRIRQHGFRVALDDFGTGYSNLARVKSFQLDCIKVDKTFVADVGERQTDLAIVGSITHLASSLGVDVVAEGVETRTQADVLSEIGCTHLQGWLFGAAESIQYAIERVTRPASSRHAHPDPHDNKEAS